MSKTFHTLKVLSGNTCVNFYQYFLPSLAILYFFSLSDNCFNDFLADLSNIFFLSSRLFIQSTKKSTTIVGSTLKSLFKSTRGSSSSTGATYTGFSTFFSSTPFLLFFFCCLSYYYLAYCSLLSFSSSFLCFYFSLTYLHLFAISSMKMLSSSVLSICSVFLRISNFSLSFCSWLALSNSSLILSSKMKSAS